LKEWADFENPTRNSGWDENLRWWTNLNDNPELTLARKEIEWFVLNIRAVEEKKMYGQICGPNNVVSRGHFVLG